MMMMMMVMPTMTQINGDYAAIDDHLLLTPYQLFNNRLMVVISILTVAKWSIKSI